MNTVVQTGIRQFDGEFHDLSRNIISSWNLSFLSIGLNRNSSDEEV
jgi:hypothetical protein